MYISHAGFRIPDPSGLTFCNLLHDRMQAMQKPQKMKAKVLENAKSCITNDWSNDRKIEIRTVLEGEIRRWFNE